jgi:DNA-binding CsgD family transcriptional regulator
MLVGRDTELAILDSLTARAAAGAGGVVLVSGEPGAGKTRLAREAAGRAHGAAVSWGACRECEGAPPLWPWMQVLSWPGEAAVTTSHPVDGPAARFQLFERIGHALRESAAATPQLVVVDDLHRADEASLRLLAYLSETLWPVPLGMIVTYRHTEVPPASLAARVIGSLAHGAGSRRCELGGLSEQSVAQWLRAAGIDDVDAADLHARTGGNPLFVSESIRLFAAGSRPGTPLRSVREVIRERLGPLPDDCREALEVASVLGRDFEYPPLAAALRISPARAVAALDPAVHARLVRPDEARAGAFHFVHALIRDAVEEQLAPSRRAQLHARAFTALRDTGWGQPADLAHHAVQARPEVSDEVAADTARSAAEAADRLLAWEDAAAWWRMAITLTPRGHQDTGLQMRLGRSLLLAGRVEAARACFEAAAAEAARAGDGTTLAASALAAGDTVAEVAADHNLVSLLDRALSRADVPAGPRARLLARWAIATYWQAGGRDQSRRASLAAVELAGQSGDTEALGAALIARQFTLRGPDFTVERLTAGAAVLGIATRLGDQDLRFRAYQWLVPDRYQIGAVALAAADVEQMAAIAEAGRNPLQRWWVLIYQGLLAVFAGRAGQAEELAHEAAALGRRLGQPAADAYRIGQLGRIYWAAGRLAELEDDIEQGITRFPGLVTLRCMRALACAAAGRTAEAAAEIDALAADGFAALPRDSLYLASLAILGEAAVTCRAPDLARPILDELLPYASRNLIQGVPIGWGAAAWHIARLQWLLGRRSDAARSAATAQRLHRRWGAGGLAHPLAGLGRQPAPLPLSPRELEVLTLLACGQANAEIAAALGVSVHTVERHVANVFAKLSVTNRAGATAWAYRRGLVS